MRTGARACDGPASTHASGRMHVAYAQVWMWLRPKGKGATARGDVRRVPLSPEAACLSLGHFLQVGFCTIARVDLQVVGAPHGCKSKFFIRLQEQSACAPRARAPWALRAARACNARCDARATQAARAWRQWPLRTTPAMCACVHRQQ